MRLLLTSPIGLLLAEYDADALLALRFWPQGEHPPACTRDEPARTDAVGQRVARELREYFAGERREFSLPLRFQGTAFQRDVWNALLRIPYGETRSYVEVARAVGRPGGARAVGQANARNPLPLVVPCHRVLAADGALGGYLGEWGDSSGTALKRWLLDLEARRNGEDGAGGGAVPPREREGRSPSSSLPAFP